MADMDELFHAPFLASEIAQVVRHWSSGAENVGVGSGEGELQRAFLLSPEHRANVLNRDFDRVGIGIVRRDGKCWACVRFVGR